ncbi:MAG: hypothetical protein WD431_10425, partial [Cyclobacteriaceae bacterium]
YKQIKPDMIYHYFDQDIDLIYEIVELVMDLNIQDLKTLYPLYDLGEFQTIAKKFHKSKPVFSFLGAVSVNEVIEKIEKDVENHFPLLYQNLLGQLNDLEEDLKIFLKKINH